jgi:hypothetical protein
MRYRIGLYLALICCFSPAPRPEGRLARTNQICYESICHVYYSRCQPQNVKLILREP